MKQTLNDNPKNGVFTVPVRTQVPSFFSRERQIAENMYQGSD